MATPYAFVTLLSSDSYLPGALALVAALKDIHSKPPVAPEVDFQTVCIVTPETVDVSSIKLLRKSFDLVVGVEVIEQEDIKGLQLLGRLDLNSVLTKLHIFRLTQYSKLIFLDADVLPIRPLSHLFTLPHEFSAVPDVGWPDIFNSGVMVFSPGEDKFKHLVELLKTKGSWDGGDQGLLNEWRGDNWNRLSFTYNTTPTAAYTYAPAYERFGARISAIHFIGPNKPWKSLPWREPGQKSVDQPQLGPQQTYDYSALLDRWFQVYDRHYRIDTPVSRSDFEVQRYSSAWDAVSSAGDNSSISATTPLQGVFGLADLRRIATEGYSSSGNKSYPVAMPVEGQYRSMPLDGRVDLMRPRKQPEPEAEVSQDGPGEQTPTARDTAGFDQGQHELPEGVQQMRMYTLPTPGPNEVPPTPYGHYQSLPSSETPTPYYGPASVGYRDDHDHQRGHSHHHHFEQAQFTLHLPQGQDSDQYSSEPSAPVRGWHSPQTPHRSHHAGGHQQHTSPQTVSPTYSPTRSRRGGVPDGQPTSSPQSTHSTQHTGPHGHTDRGARHSPSHSRNPSFQHGAQPAHQERHGEPTLNVSQQRQQQHSPIQDHQFPPYLQSPRPQPPSPHWSSPQSQQHWSSSPQQHSSQQYVPQQQQHTPQHNPQQHSSPNHVIPHDQMPRSPSPPKVTWNPAVEPPPHDPPTQSAFPVDTYFPNIWDQAPSQIHDATYQSFPSDPTTPQPKSPAVFFDPPPPSTIPEQLLREGRYSNVLGHPTQEQSPGIPSAGPTPDRNKVKSVFPWEDKPRHVPRRVFPSSDLPPADKFVEEVKVSPVSPRNPTHGRTNSQPHTHSPPGGFPPQLSFSNAWDNVPSIQKFASKLLHPRQPSLTLPPTPDNSWRKRERREWQERQDASSMDGDDEDEGESDASVESDGNDKKGKQRSRASSSASAPAPSRGKKEYRMRGVQTVSPEMMNKGVQVTILREDGTIRLNSSSKRSVSVGVEAGPSVGLGIRREWPSTSSASSLLPSAVLRDFKTEPEQVAGTPTVNVNVRSSMPFPSLASPTGLISPQTLGSPRTYSPPKILSPPPPQAQSPVGVTSPKTVTSPRPGTSRRASASGSPPMVTSPRQMVPGPSPASTGPLQVTSPRPAARRSSTATSPLRADSPVLARGQTSTPPPRLLPKLSSPFSPQITRSISQETNATMSPSSTQSSLATPENTPVLPVRKGGRVWDPSRGVDVFKRGSEEVLARFLKMGSFEEGESQKPHVS